MTPQTSSHIPSHTSSHITSHISNRITRHISRHHTSHFIYFPRHTGLSVHLVSISVAEVAPSLAAQMMSDTGSSSLHQSDEAVDQVMPFVPTREDMPVPVVSSCPSQCRDVWSFSEESSRPVASRIASSQHTSDADLPASRIQSSQDMLTCVDLLETESVEDFEPSPTRKQPCAHMNEPRARLHIVSLPCALLMQILHPRTGRIQKTHTLLWRTKARRRMFQQLLPPCQISPPQGQQALLKRAKAVPLPTT